jgi:uncharacterized protein (TIGR03086 family)
MSDVDMPNRAAAALIEIVRGVKPDQVAAPTPCAEYDVRLLLNHLLFWGPSLEGAARKESVPPPAGSESEVDLTEGDWAAAVAAQAERIAAAWSRPAAWEGTTHMGGPMELPASMVGGMVVIEVLVHGWDLARATGQHWEWDGDLVTYTLGEVVKTAEQGRQMGVFGPEVTVPGSAPALDRVLALTGRDPAWTPPA